MIKISKIESFRNKIEDCEHVNLVIGPNNCGKTIFLKEIFQCLDSVTANPHLKWIKNLYFYTDNLKKTASKIIPNVFRVDDFNQVSSILETGYDTSIPTGDLWNQKVYNACKSIQDCQKEFKTTQSFQNDNNGQLWRFLLRSYSFFEDCEKRINSRFETDIHDILTIKEGDVIGYFYINQKIFEKIQINIKEIFGIDVGFDNFPQGNHSLRILPKTEIKKTSNLIEAATQWKNESLPIKDQGHGIRAYLKLVFSLLQPNKSIILIDEPEAFLHPPQCRAIGSLIASLSIDEKKQVFIATHNPDILRGVLTSRSSNIKIFYLRRDEDNFDYSILEANEIRNFIQSKSRLVEEDILSSFFHKKTVLCEAPDDRLIYDRLIYDYASSLYFNNIHQNVNFVGLNGKGAVQSVFDKLNEIWLSVSAIVDIDFIIDGRFPSSINNTALKQEFRDIQHEVKEQISNEEIDKTKFKANGLKYLKNKNPALFTKTEGLLTRLSNKNFFVVPVGEVESWTKDNIKGNINIQSQLDVLEKKRKVKLIKFLNDVLA